MFRGKVASIQRLQEKARPRPWLRGSLCPVLLGVAFALAAPADRSLAASTLVAAPDGKFQGKLDTTGTVRQFLGVRYAQQIGDNKGDERRRHLLDQFAFAPRNRITHELIGQLADELFIRLEPGGSEQRRQE